MIPKIIHYCWFGGYPIPNDLKRYMDSWKKYAPDYQIIRWDESNFDLNCHPFVESAYNAKAWAFVSDYARLKVVYENGGIYLDTDVELLKNIDFLLENKCYIGVQQHGKLCTTGLGFGAIKYSPVVKEMLNKYNGLYYNEEIKNDIACPWLNNAVIESYGYKYSNKTVVLEEVTIYPSKYFDPLSTGKTSDLLCNDTISIHHYAASWMSKRIRFKRRIIRVLGERNYYRLKKIAHRTEQIKDRE